MSLSEIRRLSAFGDPNADNLNAEIRKLSAFGSPDADNLRISAFGQSADLRSSNIVWMRISERCPKAAFVSALSHDPVHRNCSSHAG